MIKEQALLRMVVGAPTAVIYETARTKPRHGLVRWSQGIWSHALPHFEECQRRHCLLLVSIDPDTQEQVYHHGDSSSGMRINPRLGGFAKLQPWLEACHAEDDRAPRVAMPVVAAAASAEPRGLGRLFRMFG